MAEGTMDRLATPASSDSQSQTALPTPERTPTHGAARAPTSDEICAGDQGIWHMSSSEFWPVLVLRQEMVPDSLRRSPEDESQVPVFLLAKDSIEYAPRQAIETKHRQYFEEELMQTKSTAQSHFRTALFQASEERSEADYLRTIKEKYRSVTKEWKKRCTDHGHKSRNAGLEFMRNVKLKREASAAELGREDANDHRKRLRPEIIKTGHNLPEYGEVEQSSLTTRTTTGLGASSFDDATNASLQHWTIHEDAALIRLRELMMPDASWAEIVSRFHKKFVNCNRSHSSIRSRYLNKLHPEAVAKGPQDPVTCARLRARAVSLLEHAETFEEEHSSAEETSSLDDPEMEEATSDEDESSEEVEYGWTSAQDAELIRLNEHGRARTTQEVRKLFRQRFPLSLHPAQEIRYRYKYVLQPQAGLKYDGDAEECATARAMALSILEASGSKEQDERRPKNGADGQPPGAGQRWKGEEDACLVYMREECAETSWSRVQDVFNNAFPGTSRTMSAMRSRYNDYLQPDASLKGCKFAGPELCDELRARALSLIPQIDISGNGRSQETTPSDKLCGSRNVLLSAGRTIELNMNHDREVPEHPDFASGANKKWSAEEDAHLIQLREKHMKDASWQQRLDVWQKTLPLSPRTKSALENRYRYYLVPNAQGQGSFGPRECQEMRDRALAFLLEYGENEMMKQHCDVATDPNSRGWTVEEDAVLLRLREQAVGRPDWSTIAQTFRRNQPNSLRTTGAMQERYRNYLAPDATGRLGREEDVRTIRERAQNFAVTLKTRSAADPGMRHAAAAVGSPKSFSVAEDAEILRLKERTSYKLSWDAILQAFKKMFPTTKHRMENLKERYSRYLAEDAVGRGEITKGKNAYRQRASAYLDQQEQQERRGVSHRPRPNAKTPNNVISLLSDDDTASETDDETDDDSDEASGMGEGRASYLSQTVKIEADDEVDEEDDDTLDAEVGQDSENEFHADGLTFLIGEEQEQFHVPITRTLHNTYIVQDTVQSNNLGAIVTGSRWNRLKSADFRPVYEYLKYGDYRPRLQNGKLVGLAKTPGSSGREALRCTQVFAQARDLHLDELMSLAVRKFQVLPKQPLSIILGVPSVFKSQPDGTKEDKLMRQVLIEDAATNFRVYMSEVGTKFWALQKKYPEFVSEVLKRVSADAERLVAPSI